jgi:hypothetical protein
MTYLFVRRKLSRYRKSKRKDWYKTFVFIALYLAFLALTAIYLLLSYWYVWMVLAAVGLATLVFWHAKATAYRCPICACVFEISALADFLEPHGVTKKGGWTYMKCPCCHNRSKMEILVKTGDK